MPDISLKRIGLLGQPSVESDHLTQWIAREGGGGGTGVCGIPFSALSVGKFVSLRGEISLLAIDFFGERGAWKNFSWEGRNPFFGPTPTPVIMLVGKELPKTSQTLILPATPASGDKVAKNIP